MPRRIVILALGASLPACVLKPHDPTGIPFVSEQVIGHWEGTWEVALPGQKGDADVTVTRDAEGEVTWHMELDGGLLSGPDEPPLLYDLRGDDDVERLELAGDGDKLGHIELVIDEDGLIEGVAEPQSIPAVDIVGIVRPDELRLDFVVLDLVKGKAVVSVEGRAVPPG